MLAVLRRAISLDFSMQESALNLFWWAGSRLAGCCVRVGCNARVTVLGVAGRSVIGLGVALDITRVIWLINGLLRAYCKHNDVM